MQDRGEHVHPLCPEDVPEIDADPPSLDSGCVKGMGTAYPRPYPDWEGMPFPTLHRYCPPYIVGPGDVYLPPPKKKV